MLLRKQPKPCHKGKKVRRLNSLLALWTKCFLKHHLRVLIHWLREDVGNPKSVDLKSHEQTGLMD